jgi:opacity protein-like surface antigen
MMRAQLLLGTALTGAALMAAQPAAAQMYARLDSGFAWARDANFQDTFQDQMNGTFVIGQSSSRPSMVQEIGSSWLVDGGIGFRFNPWLRADLTVGYRGGYELDDVAEEIETFEFINSYAGTLFAEITSIPVLFNAYVDLGGITGLVGPNIVPYVGAGFGFARNEIGTIRGHALNDPTKTLTAPGGSNVDLAWAIMAGFSAPLPGVRNLFLDVGYRYLDSGKIETDGGPVLFGGEQNQSEGIIVSDHNGFEGDLTAHEFKAGLRLMLP